MRILKILPILALLHGFCIAQQAKVFLYTPPFPITKQLRNLVVPTGTAPIGAWVHDEKELLAFVPTNRFLVLNLQPGTHKFFAREGKWAPKQVAELNLAAGATYCLRTNTRYAVVPVAEVGYAWAQLAVIPCDEAAKELATAKPVEARDIDKKQTKNVDACMTPPPIKGKTRMSDPQPVADPVACLGLLHAASAP